MPLDGATRLIWCEYREQPSDTDRPYRHTGHRTDRPGRGDRALWHKRPLLQRRRRTDSAGRAPRRGRPLQRRAAAGTAGRRVHPRTPAPRPRHLACHVRGLRPAADPDGLDGARPATATDRCHPRDGAAASSRLGSIPTHRAPTRPSTKGDRRGGSVTFCLLVLVPCPPTGILPSADPPAARGRHRGAERGRPAGERTDVQADDPFRARTRKPWGRTAAGAAPRLWAWRTEPSTTTTHVSLMTIRLWQSPRRRPGAGQAHCPASRRRPQPRLVGVDRRRHHDLARLGCLPLPRGRELTGNRS